MTERKVAIFVDHAVSHPSFGRLEKGFSIVTQEEADNWMSVSTARIATPSEVAAAYGL